MVPVVRCEQWQPSIWRWWGFSPDHKVELMSHAVRGPGGAWVVFDPIPMDPDPLRAWGAGRRVEAILLTNGNHERAAAAWRPVWDCPVLGPAGVSWEMEGIRSDQEVLPEGWQPFRLEGGAPGETAWWLPSKALMVFGDAVVNLSGRGLELLPDKYCQDPRRLRESLRSLVSIPFESALFAHGDPIPQHASVHIGELLRGVKWE
jgi:glyoxylase-like metal-dependent hydrolase (beta-lactamase superfamily II)